RSLPGGPGRPAGPRRWGSVAPDTGSRRGRAKDGWTSGGAHPGRTRVPFGREATSRKARNIRPVSKGPGTSRAFSVTVRDAHKKGRPPSPSGSIFPVRASPLKPGLPSPSRLRVAFQPHFSKEERRAVVIRFGQGPGRDQDGEGFVGPAVLQEQPGMILRKGHGLLRPVLQAEAENVCPLLPVIQPNISISPAGALYRLRPFGNRQHEHVLVFQLRPCPVFGDGRLPHAGNVAFRHVLSPSSFTPSAMRIRRGAIAVRSHPSDSMASSSREGPTINVGTGFIVWVFTRKSSLLPWSLTRTTTSSSRF